MRRLGCHAGTVYDGRIDMSRWRRQTMVVRLLLFVRFARCHVIYGRKHMLKKAGRVPQHRMEVANTTCKHPRLLQSRRRTSSQSTEPYQPIEPPTPHAHQTSRLFPSPRSPVRLCCMTAPQYVATGGLTTRIALAGAMYIQVHAHR